MQIKINVSQNSYITEVFRTKHNLLREKINGMLLAHSGEFFAECGSDPKFPKMVFVP